MLATSQMEAIALAISAVFGGDKKGGGPTNKPPENASELQAGLSAFFAGR